jgi:hypothetical protein
VEETESTRKMKRQRIEIESIAVSKVRCAIVLRGFGLWLTGDVTE